MITLRQSPMQSLRDTIYGSIPRPQPSAAPIDGICPPAKRLLILSRYPNPSVSYYLDERVRALTDIPVILKGLDDSLDDVDCQGLFVVICRYIKGPQLRWLEHRQKSLAGIAYFVDDDIPAVIAGNEANWLYKFRLLNFAIRPLPLSLRQPLHPRNIDINAAISDVAPEDSTRSRPCTWAGGAPIWWPGAMTMCMST